ncbi:unnamed protein product [Diatraea saccharalis]|uniref:Uncharacterized protein n=1 Tax=Diatraea saccharalis TaxID=40085 RepID=A0A9N9R4X1_9NEOP|nr:unnamed protein product [Diatraea saccharalis]
MITGQQKRQMTVWRDLKSRACTKAAKLKKEKAQTGKQDIDTLPLTEVKRRIVSLVGADYTGGTNCPDSIARNSGIEVQDIAENIAPTVAMPSITESLQPSTSQSPPICKFIFVNK